MKQATMIVIESKQCREASKNHFPIEPDELFNQTWLKLKEKEIKDPEWRPQNAVAYFLTMIKTVAADIKNNFSRKLPFEENRYQAIEPETDERIEREIALIKWINSPSNNDDELFYKNIILITIYSKDINSACDAVEMDRKRFWKYRKDALKKFYDCTNYHANIDHVHDLDLV